MAAPAAFIPLTSINYNPSVTGVSANRVAITSSMGAPLATNVAFITFDFTPQDGGTDFGYSGYAEIILEGNNASSATASTVVMNTAVPSSSAASADAALVFNEIMYHPATNETGLEFVELYNQLAVDLDVSGWRVGGWRYRLYLPERHARRGTKLYCSGAHAGNVDGGHGIVFKCVRAGFFDVCNG